MTATTKSGPILVVGSANLDLVFQCPEFPRPGETLLGGEFATHPGGKGANQAVAIGRLGGDVHFCGAVGTDDFGKTLQTSLKGAGVHTTHLRHDPGQPTGTACILVSATGQNLIVVAPGANNQVTPEAVHHTLDQLRPSIVLAQLEVPLPAVEAAAKSGRFILNPAPARPLPDSLLAQTWIITPNETELEALTGIAPQDLQDVERAARQLLARGVQNAIVTLGSRGSAWISAEGLQHFPAHPVQPVDTTAAGDAFNGALAHFLAQGHDFPFAITRANAVAALSTLKSGAQPSMPTEKELEIFLERAV